TLQQRTRCVAEELRHVDALDLALRRRNTFATRRVAEEVGEEIVEEAAPGEPVRQPFLGEVELAEVLDLLCPVRTEPYTRGDRWAMMTFAEVLLDCHFNLPLMVA